MFIVLKKCKFLKQLYNKCLRKLPTQHGEVSVMKYYIFVVVCFILTFYFYSGKRKKRDLSSYLEDADTEETNRRLNLLNLLLQNDEDLFS